MKHIRQSSQEHTSGSFDIAEDVTSLRSAMYLGAVLMFPFSDSGEELVPVCLGTNPGNTEKDLSELSCICGLGGAAAPGQPLPLDMYQASLDCDIRPEFPDDLCYVGVPINRKATRMQPMPYQPLKECYELSLRVLGDTILTTNNHVGLGIHQGDKTTWAVKESPVQDEVVALPQIQHGLMGHLFQMVIDHTVKLPRTVSALARQLSDRISFNNPTPKPFLFVGILGLSITSAKRMPTRATEPTLPTISIMTISLENA